MTSSKIYDLSWNEDSFRAKWRLFKKSRRKFDDALNTAEKMAYAPAKRMRGDACFAFASSYHSIAGTAASQVKGHAQALRDPQFPPIAGLYLLGDVFTWMWLGRFCYFRELPIAHEGYRLLSWEGMNANQCDIYQSVLRAHRKYAWAETCIRVGLNKEPSAHTRGLLNVGIADIYYHGGAHRNAPVKGPLKAALQAAQEAQERGEDSNQIIRIYGKCAKLARKLTEEDRASLPMTPGEMEEKSKTLLQETRARDQELKLSA